ncbi:hypothetical protein JZX87_28055 [Agrobacterium sp. Ap1]|uniref:hypothetical protein n=1 Tax=Rhizobium/Agrobacterium group TaxID=227290 RepID=UPI001A8F0A2C|nr:hypothetical protein [Agrobacterium sp. Ap1]MBO0144995.1 hypothetical protein [Agrobacterium sp. Ap1]
MDKMGQTTDTSSTGKISTIPESTVKMHIRETIAFETKKAEFVEKLLILTIGQHTFVDRKMVYAWREAGVELIGPVLSIGRISRVAIGLVVGAIIDLDLDIDALILLTDQLDGLGIPAIFAGSQTGKAQTSGFCMSREHEAITAIMAALLTQHKVTKH